MSWTVQYWNFTDMDFVLLSVVPSDSQEVYCTVCLTVPWDGTSNIASLGEIREQRGTGASRYGGTEVMRRRGRGWRGMEARDKEAARYGGGEVRRQQGFVLLYQNIHLGGRSDIHRRTYSDTGGDRLDICRKIKAP